MSEQHKPEMSRRTFIVLTGAALGGAALACNRAGQRLIEASPMPPSSAPGASEPGSSDPSAPATTTPLIRRQVITANDFVPEQMNGIPTVLVAVKYADLPERNFDYRDHWDKIFGATDPLTQLNAYYHHTFYNQLELTPYSTPEMGDGGYVEIEFEGIPQDHAFGFLIGMESTGDFAAVENDMVVKVILDIMAGTVQAHPEIDYQDKYIFAVLNATGSEYGRGAMGAIPGAGYDVFVGNVNEADLALFSDERYFRLLDNGKLVGLIGPEGYTYEDYARDRDAYMDGDQFITGMALFGSEAPLSCASHDILHGLRRKSASANPPEARDRAINCLYNLPMQSQWLVGADGATPFDRSVNCSPYIGWWDPMGDHLHPGFPRIFFGGHPHAMCSFTKLRMGLIPQRCIAIADADDITLRIAPLGNPQLPAPGSPAEAVVAKVPLAPGVERLDHICLLLEYRLRIPGTPDGFTLSPDDVLGDKTRDPGYNAADPAASRYINPPMQFPPDEGVLVYLVNNKMPESPARPYTAWHDFVVALLNPAGNYLRDDLTQVALDAGESITVDFTNLYEDRGAPFIIDVAVTARNAEYAEVHITRQQV